MKNNIEKKLNINKIKVEDWHLVIRLRRWKTNLRPVSILNKPWLQIIDANTASSHQSVNRPQNEDNRVVLLNSNQNPNSLSSIMTLEREKEQKTSSLLQSSISLVSSSSPPKPSITPEDESASHEQPQAINSSTLPIQVQARVQYGSNQDYLVCLLPLPVHC